MTIVDTTVWIDYLRGRESAHTEWLDVHLTSERIGLLDLMVCELLQGVPSTKAAHTLEAHLRRFEIFETGGVSLAAASAAHYRTLRRRGVTVRGTIDCLIATWCITHGLPLLHTDRDFAPFEQHLGLRVVTPR
jgi:predicted nucleic acid-binding protein